MARPRYNIECHPCRPVRRTGHRRARARTLIAAATLTAVTALTSPFVSAQSTNTDDPGKQLEQIERELNDLRTTEAERRTQQKQLDDETAALKTTIIETAEQIQMLEAALFEAEKRLEQLTDDEHIATVTMREERDKLYHLLSAMQALERQRPPALIVNPNDAVQAVRSAILMDQILPVLRDRTDSLVQQINDLKILRADIKRETEDIARSETRLMEEKTNNEFRMGKIADQQQQLQQASSVDRKRITELANQARNLKSLIKQLGAEAKKSAAERKIAENEPDPAPDLRKNTPVPAANPARGDNATSTPNSNDLIAKYTPKLPRILVPKLKFTEALGQIKLPVAGSAVLNYGDTDELGRKAEGISITTRANAQVVAPFSGKIAYAGPFLEFDQLLLIDVGEGYHIVLTGLTTIFGSVGDTLRSGEPVGLMGSDAFAANHSAGARAAHVPGGTRQLLYMEFRKNGDPINPRRWLVKDERKANG